MIRHGDPPYLECSSKGDRRFSAFGARLKSREFQSIEEIYQGAKVFEDGVTKLNWRAAKGRKALNQEYVAKLYTELWEEYIEENPHLKEVLINVTGLSDVFGQEGHQCQATVLWGIRARLLKESSKDNV